MASTLPPGALGKAADSIKALLSQSVEDDTTSNDLESSSIKNQTVGSQEDDTTIDKHEEPTVEHETIKPHEHEKINTVIEKEVHQDHYHRTIQPVKDEKILPTKHTFKENETNREYDHRSDDAVKKSEEEGVQFQDEQKIDETSFTKEREPTQHDEHIHHHIHESVQPIIERKVIQPEVVHTTDHIHETHHLNSEHHDATTAPAISLSEFKNVDDSQKASGSSQEYLKGESKDVETTEPLVSGK